MISIASRRRFSLDVAAGDFAYFEALVFQSTPLSAESGDKSAPRSPPALLTFQSTPLSAESGDQAQD